LWQRSVHNRGRMLHHEEDNDTHFFFPQNAFDFVRPSFSCPHGLERVGALGDGGKWVCGMNRYEDVAQSSLSLEGSGRPLVIYSFGIGGDASFERDMLERTQAEIWGYDHTVDGWPVQHISGSLLDHAHSQKLDSDPQQTVQKA
jgi:hypothetical protein